MEPGSLDKKDVKLLSSLIIDDLIGMASETGRMPAETIEKLATALSGTLKAVRALCVMNGMSQADASCLEIVTLMVMISARVINNGINEEEVYPDLESLRSWMNVAFTRPDKMKEIYLRLLRRKKAEMAKKTTLPKE